MFIKFYNLDCCDLEHEYLFLYGNSETNGSVNTSRNLQATINKNRHLNRVHYIAKFKLKSMPVLLNTQNIKI